LVARKTKSKEIAILAAARKLFVEIGLYVTTDAIALESGVVKSTIYSYFSDKECLLEAVIRLESDVNNLKKASVCLCMTFLNPLD
jgi:TetR/AcrR family transcriptional repressor of mexJK operon